MLGAVALRMQVPGAVYVMTADAALTSQPVAPAEFTEYTGLPPPTLITARAEAAEPESAATSVVTGAQVIERVALVTSIVSDTAVEAVCVDVAPATT